MAAVDVDAVLVHVDWGESPCQALNRKILLLDVAAPSKVNCDLESVKVVVAGAPADAAEGAHVVRTDHEMFDADTTDPIDQGDSNDLSDQDDRDDIAEPGAAVGAAAEAAVAGAAVVF